MTVRALLIDPFARTVTEIQHDASDYRNIYAAIDCQTFDCVRIDDQGHTLYIDDEGKWAEPKALWQIGSFPHPLINRGLILGTDDEGESCACTLKVADLARAIRWTDIGVMPATVITDLNTGEREIIGEPTVVTRTPKKD